MKGACFRACPLYCVVSGAGGSPADLTEGVKGSAAAMFTVYPMSANAAMVRALSGLEPALSVLVISSAPITDSRQ